MCWGNQKKGNTFSYTAWFTSWIFTNWKQTRLIGSHFSGLFCLIGLETPKYEVSMALKQVRYCRLPQTRSPRQIISFLLFHDVASS